MHNFSGTLIGMVHIMLPFLILPVYGTMQAIDRDLMKAAANLGASPARAFWSVFFPLSLPGLIAGALIVFILCLGFYVTPAVLGGGKVTMVSNRIANDIEIFFNWGAASALGVVLLVLTLADRLCGGPAAAARAACSARATRHELAIPTSLRRRRSRTARACGCTRFAALVLAFLTLPTLIVVPMSFSGSQYLEFPPATVVAALVRRSYFGSASWMQATGDIASRPAR